MAVTDPRGYTTHSVYDAKNQLVETLYYNAVGEAIETIDIASIRILLKR
ncbi:MAG: hypothetical protein J7641_22615 [Cyanobacteria bacterium SID2]|nr:hypothetical protein [Cyanobacteria bacterium SID2]MBP0005211.1 hypothetical protein [Cyanobacteria bacterium SBC]